MLYRLLCSLLPLWCISFSAFAEQNPSVPPPPDPGYAPLQGMKSPEAWAPGTDTALVSAVSINDRTVLRMPCAFQGKAVERAYWTRNVSLNLSAARGIRFQFFCADPAPVLEFVFYLRSGNGWYRLPFSIDAPGAWKVVSADRLKMEVEGTPAGWQSIDAIRIGAFKMVEADTEFYITDFGVMTAESALVLICGDWAAKQYPKEAASLRKSVETMSALLDGIGLPFIPLSDTDVSSKQLTGKKVAILPYNPSLPQSTASALLAFLKDGGKLLSFYELPKALQNAAGIQLGEHVKQSRPGNFASFRRSGDALEDMPEIVRQVSWNIRAARPARKDAKVAAMWYSDQDEAVNQPAVLVSKQAIHTTHVLLKDDPDNKRLLLLSMIGHFAPDAALASAKWHIAHAGVLGPYSTFDAAQKAIAPKATDESAKTALQNASAFLNDARMRAEKGAIMDAVRAARRAHDSLLEAYCRTQAPKPGERRLFWCHDAYGVTGWTWDEAIKNLADNGFTDILPNVLWGGCAYYPGDVLPVSWLVKERGDALAQCISACKKYKVNCHAWKVCWNMGSKATPAFRQRMKSEGRLQVRSDGKTEDDWLCPSNPANQKLEVDALVELVTKYEVAGVHLDYIRYPGAKTCYCTGCRKRFEKAIGATLTNWPKVVAEDPARKAQWLEFRRAQITQTVAAISEAVRKARPGTELSAAVYTNWPQHRDTIGQDWKTWCDKGYLNFVCPMDYTEHNAQFENMVKQQLAWCGKAALYPGIGLSVWPEGPEMTRLIDQISITRRLGAGGFTVFNYRTQEAQSILPLCGMGITKP